MQRQKADLLEGKEDGNRMNSPIIGRDELGGDDDQGTGILVWRDRETWFRP